MAINAMIPLSGRAPNVMQASEAKANALANQAAGQKNQMMATQMAEYEAQAPRRAMLQERDDKTYKQDQHKAAIEDMRNTLPTLDASNWNQYGAYMAENYGDAGVFDQPYSEEIHEKMMKNLGASRVSDREKHDLSVRKADQVQERFETLGAKHQMPYLQESERLKARSKIVGKGEGEALERLTDIESRLGDFDVLADKLSGLSDDATFTRVGRIRDDAARQIGRSTKGGIARAEYQSTIDNEILPLLRSTFGAAFTEGEGDRLRATLGDANSTPEEKKAALRAFVASKHTEVAQLGRRTESMTGQQQDQAPRRDYPPTNPQGWELFTDGSGNRAYVDPISGQIQELN